MLVCECLVCLLCTRVCIFVCICLCYERMSIFVFSYISNKERKKSFRLGVCVIGETCGEGNLDLEKNFKPMLNLGLDFDPWSSSEQQ